LVPQAFASDGEETRVDPDAGTTVATTTAILRSRTPAPSPASIRKRPRRRLTNSLRSKDDPILTPPFDFDAEQRHHEPKHPPAYASGGREVKALQLEMC
jgi:hypothetical protein